MTITIRGSGASETIDVSGTWADYEIYGLAGDDRVIAGIGEDYLYGGKGADELLGGFFGIQLEIAPADDLLRGAADEAGRRLVDEHVFAFEILDENRVRCRVDDREQDVRRVLDRQHGRKAS